MSLITPEHLKPEAKKILGVPNSFFTIKEGEISWQGFETDLAVFDNVIAELVSSHQESDGEFRRHTLPRIDVRLAGAEFFARLGYTDISVTQGHNGTTPYFHSLNTLKSLDTSPFAEYPDFVFILRGAALFHDLGKGMSSGITLTPEVQNIIEGALHSHPGHAIMSALVLQKLCQNSAWLSDEKMMRSFADVLTLVRHHHLFTDVTMGRNEASIKSMLTQFGHRPKLILALFLLTRADVGSNHKYHKYWQPNIETFVHIYKTHIFTEYESLAQACLALPDLLVQTEAV